MDPSLESPPRLYILITGANSGVGLGIATRLLLQLSAPSQGPPADSLPQQSPFIISPSNVDADLARCPYMHNSGVTFILACRSEARALKARAQLLSRLDKDLLERNGGRLTEEDREFKRNLEIVWEGLDLSDMRNVYGFIDRVKSSYPYITHLYLNAGVGAWSQINWLAAFYEFFTTPVKCLTDPSFKLQETGWKSEKDGLGWVWQCGVFGHWCIAQALLPTLSASPVPARIIWTSSLVTSVFSDLDLTDLQCVKTDKSYELTKRQIDLLSASLDQKLQEGGSGARSILCDPAVTASEIYRPQLGVVLYQVMLMAFYAVRFIANTTDHCIDILTGSIAMVHLGLLHNSLIPSPPSASTSPSSNGKTISSNISSDHDPSSPPSSVQNTPASDSSKIGRAYKFRSQADRWGKAYVKVSEFEYEKEEQRELERLIEEERTKWARAVGSGASSGSEKN